MARVNPSVSVSVDVEDDSDSEDSEDQAAHQVLELMAESSSEAASSSGSVAAEATTTASQPGAGEPEKPEEFLEPERKRRKLPGQVQQSQAQDASPAAGLQLAKPEQKLEHRLGGILCCVVCFDLPRAAVYQVRTLPHYSHNLCFCSFFLVLA